MSMMTSYVLCAIEQRLIHVTSHTNGTPLQKKLVLLVGDLAQYINIHFKMMN